MSGMTGLYGLSPQAPPCCGGCGGRGSSSCPRRRPCPGGVGGPQRGPSRGPLGGGRPVWGAQGVGGPCACVGGDGGRGARGWARRAPCARAGGRGRWSAVAAAGPPSPGCATAGSAGAGVGPWRAPAPQGTGVAAVGGREAERPARALGRQQAPFEHSARPAEPPPWGGAPSALPAGTGRQPRWWAEAGAPARPGSRVAGEPEQLPTGAGSLAGFAASARGAGGAGSSAGPPAAASRAGSPPAGTATGIGSTCTIC